MLLWCGGNDCWLSDQVNRCNLFGISHDILNSWQCNDSIYSILLYYYNMNVIL